MRAVLRDYGLGVVLAALFVASWLVQSLAGWVEFAADQHAHGEAAALFGESGYLWTWLASTFENWQSEFLQLFTMVVLTALLVHKGSTESKDADAKVERTLRRIEDRLAQ